MSSATAYPYDLSQYPTFPGSGGYIYEEASTESSPSPVTMYSHFEPNGFENYSDAVHAYPSYEVPVVGPLVEFTDLTATYNEDRRRRRPHATKDKQTISSMHMRRRAQNRASQRAFRDRKEKHAQDLQRQLDELEGKHQELLTAYRKLDSTNSKLTSELEELRTKISTVQSSRQETVEELMSSEIFDHFEFDQSVQAGASSTENP